MRKKSYLTVTDQFCGAGGSSQGVRNAAERIKGIEVKLAMNHWKLAIETHNTNFPGTIHDCTDVSAVDPRRYPSTDILITSPECTNHSLAKGKRAVSAQMDLFSAGKLDPAAERSRATMWDVCRFAEYHKYQIIIVENVVDARKWLLYDAWLKAMHALGYDHRSLYLNSMHFHPTPQSRDRMYIVFWKRGNKIPNLDFSPVAHCPKCSKDIQAVQVWKNRDRKFGKYRQQYVYRCPVHTTEVEPYYYAAFNCIDWSIPSQKISERAKALSPNTERRIQAGLDKYGDEPFTIHTTYSGDASGMTRSVMKPGFTQIARKTQALVQPFIINDQQSTGIGFRAKSVKDPVSCVTTAPRLKLISPFIIKSEHTKANGSYIKHSAEPLQTQTTRQAMAVITPPLIVENKGTSHSKPVTAPLGCVTTVNYHGIITDESFRAFLSQYYNGSNVISSVTDPIRTVTTMDRTALTTYKAPRLEDCFYRMIRAREVKLAMAFDNDYVVLGSEKDQVKQCGNAVTPPVMEWIIERCAESLQ